MSNRQFLILTGTLIAVFLIFLFIDKYRRCIEFGGYHCHMPTGRSYQHW